MASRFKNEEMKPIINFIVNARSNKIIREAAKRYLVIACVSLIEEFLLRLARRTIDKKINISVFGREISNAYAKNPVGTPGEFTAGYYFLGNAEKIEYIFSRILNSDSRFANLNITFFEAVRRLDQSDHSREFRGLGTKYLYKNLPEFKKVFEIRHQIIHGMAKVRLSNTRVFCFCDYTLNFLSAAIALCIMDDDILRAL